MAVYGLFGFCAGQLIFVNAKKIDTGQTRNTAIKQRDMLTEVLIAKQRAAAVNMFCEGDRIMANLTAKELTAIQDQLGIEENLIKKYNMYAQQTQDNQIKTKCEEIACKHQNHFNTLLNHLS